MLTCSLICLSPQHGEVEINDDGHRLTASSIHLCPHEICNLQAKEGADPKGEKREGNR
jgi:hypothetical protein